MSSRLAAFSVFTAFTVFAVFALSTPAVAANREAEREKNKKAPVVAVFPFKVLNKEDKFQSYGEGAAEAIINKIVNDKSLRIVEESQLDKAINALARNQSGLFEEESALAVGQMVDARFIVIGSVQVVADQVAVTSRLLEVDTRLLLASARSTQPIANIFGAYDEVAAQILSRMTFQLSQRITAGESADEIAVRQLIEDAKSYDPQFPTARDPKGGAIGKDLAKSLALYNKAVLRDPKNAVGQLALGDAESRMSAQLAASDGRRSKQLLESARDHLLTSTKADDQNAFAWAALGRAQGRLDNHKAARDAFEKALSLDANLVTARFGLAVALYNLNELEAAREAAVLAKNAGDARAPNLVAQIDQRIAMARQKPNPPK